MLDTHTHPQESGFAVNLDWNSKGWVEETFTGDNWKRRERGEGGAHQREREASPEGVTGARPSVRGFNADEGWVARERGKPENREMKREPVARARAESLFLKNTSWAHQTVYSACSVHTGQCTSEMGSAPARRCTGLSGEPRQRGFWKFSNFLSELLTKPNPNL
jgi:hypothetical protein